MAKIKILVSSRPKLLSDVIRKLIVSQLDMEIVGQVTDPLKLLAAASDTDVDAVLITPIKANGAPRICNLLFLGHPQLNIVTLEADSHYAYLYRLGLRRLRFETPSSQTILNLLRGGPIPLEAPKTEADEVHSAP